MRGIEPQILVKEPRAIEVASLQTADHLYLTRKLQGKSTPLWPQNIAKSATKGQLLSTTAL